ncbi:MAG: 2-oxoglutarate dehydrogenase, E2 component, dihydrolipoamide succinyltransferase [Planctomycetota bacterium]
MPARARARSPSGGAPPSPDCITRSSPDPPGPRPVASRRWEPIVSTEVKMPQMGESIAEGTLTRWFKKPGEKVVRDEPLFEISTDKVDAEVPAPADGVLEKILVEEGATVEVNTTVAMLGSGDGAASAPAAAEAPPEPAPEPQAESAPAPPPPAPAPVTPAATASTAGATSTTAVATSTHGERSKVRSSPLVRKIAREHGISDISVIPGTGAGGRITKHDILGYIDSNGAAAPAAPPAPAAAPAAAGVVVHQDALPVLNLPRENTRVERMTVMRKKIAEHMIDSRRTSAHVHSVFEADMTNVVKIRNRNKDSFLAKNGVKLTFTPFFMKACIDALREFPWLNASLDGDEIVMHNSIHFGVAVALEGGLIVPVVKNAEELNITGLQKRVLDLAGRARSKKLVPDEVAGGTFTITNPGQFGGLFGIPIISQPQVAILGVGGIQRRPVVVENDAIAIRDMAYLCISYDHRLVDGAMADQFMARVKHNLENFDDAELR